MRGPLVIPDRAGLEAAVGVELGPGPWLRIDQQRIDTFADATGDHQWIHTDLGRAQQGPYGRTIAHGYLTLSLISSLAEDLYRFDLGTARLNYGLDKVRFPTPVPVGSRVRLRCTIAAVTERAGGLLVPIDFTVQLEGSDKPACLARKMSLILTG
ncbi:dehydratase [Intrasporangium chromatireducens Q5-1]|uniref:Dehydratase n=1 Tax=Intrasporangium chromatireducens Q5-1 TaxID=584657 RepID=W9GND1_9MICO|nr:MaoC family dehydratase [Intrasporangium chromatireducens]EWT06338.1 dehydratase [Intrasporangium chromatireducens Q5-1]